MSGREPTLIGIFKADLLRKVPTDYELDDGSRVAVIGGGPAGSYFSLFLLDMARTLGLDLHVDVYEPRDYFTPGPVGCNMCGGIISESLVQMLATEGINLPSTVVQRGIETYTLHMDVGSVVIQTPRKEMRIGAVHRGAGPRDLKEPEYDSFDGFLQKHSLARGANVIQERVTNVTWQDGRPRVKTKSGESEPYDLLVVAVGVNSAALKLFKDIDLAYQPPESTKTFIREYYVGRDVIREHIGNSMHVFLLDIPRLEFAAAIPKGNYVTVCLLGEDIDQALFDQFLDSPQLRNCMPPGWEKDEFSCGCAPRMNIHAAVEPFADRLVFIGDSGVTRLFKDGIGGAYRTAKAAASTAVFQGVSAEDFRQHYWPTCDTIDKDNGFGRLIFLVTDLIKKRRFARRAVLRLTANEQRRQGGSQRMSMILWDMFTGSAPYKEIFMRTLHPAYIAQFVWSLLVSLFVPPQTDVPQGGLTGGVKQGAAGRLS